MFISNIKVVKCSHDSDIESTLFINLYSNSFFYKIE